MKVLNKSLFKIKKKKFSLRILKEKKFKNRHRNLVMEDRRERERGREIGSEKEGKGERVEK